jgi:hypothetical protein
MMREQFDSFTPPGGGLPGVAKWKTRVYFGTKSYVPFISCWAVGKYGELIAAYEGVSCISADGHTYLNAVELLEYWIEMPQEIRDFIGRVIAICEKCRSEDESEFRNGAPCS